MAGRKPNELNGTKRRRCKRRSCCEARKSLIEDGLHWNTNGSQRLVNTNGSGFENTGGVKLPRNTGPVNVGAIVRCGAGAMRTGAAGAAGLPPPKRTCAASGRAKAAPRVAMAIVRFIKK